LLLLRLASPDASLPNRERKRQDSVGRTERGP
jgi:hypothetical protein